MCGIAGIFEFRESISGAQLKNVTEAMAATLHHRGPDDQGVWVGESGGIAFGHRRLAVVDLTQSGHQPMHSEDRQLTITYNGEIYNFRAIREDLARKGHIFRGTSDTEVILKAIGQWGIRQALEKFVGMFAFALWDAKSDSLWLARDRMGEKPLYYGWMGKTFIFGSELKALKAHPNFIGEVDLEALALYFRHTCVPSPRSIYKGIRKLSPGTLVCLPKNATPGQMPVEEKYWSLKEIAENGARNILSHLNDQAAVDQLEEILKEAIKNQMLADVPVGAFLSGGIDSSLIVALMQSLSKNAVKTFTIGFGEPDYNEAPYASEVAKYLGTDHTELYVTSEDALNVIQKLPSLYDEPFADASQIPTYLVSQLTRQHVTVSLSGDGGDELFGGYSRYFMTDWMWKRIGWLPQGIRSLLAKTVNPLAKNLILSFYQSFNTDRLKMNFVDRIEKGFDVFGAKTPEEIYARIASHWHYPEFPVLGIEGKEPLMLFNDLSRRAQGLDSFHQLLYFDSTLHLPDTILTKLDRASMGVSLESRVPLLDHRGIEYAWRLPKQMKVRNGNGKWILRDLLKRYVPEQFLNRPKVGFELPLKEWLRGPLKEWANELLDPVRVKQEGYLNPKPIWDLWQAHLNKKYDSHYYLWSALMFQSWLERNKS